MRFSTRSPGAVCAFIVACAIVQLVALGQQFAQGYRPFTNAPSRVLFSWDMFATPVERCTLNWTPPLELPGRRLESLRALQLTFEWDLVFDTIEDYKALHDWLCKQGSNAQTQGHLGCFSVAGKQVNETLSCR